MPSTSSTSPFSSIVSIFKSTPEALRIYWVLARIMVPITIAGEFLIRIGAIEAIAPAFAPIMGIVGLPPELGLAWLTAMLVSMWAAVPLLFTLVPISSLSVADVTIFSALILFAHGLPIEQKIIQEAGPKFAITTLLRIAGGLIYAIILHQIFTNTGWFASPVDPIWIPMAATSEWSDFFISLFETMVWMLVILVGLFWMLELLKVSGLLDMIMVLLSPILRLAGVKDEAAYLTSVGLFLGISYGAGLLIREAKSKKVSPKQIFLSCVFMGFAHSVIEDTLFVMALGADVYSVLIGRVIFAIIATAAIAALIKRISDEAFYSHAFSLKAIERK
ncbi:MAG: nucleoside recognition domain-containing protein [Nitratireductor sp.]